MRAQSLCVAARRLPVIAPAAIPGSEAMELLIPSSSCEWRGLRSTKVALSARGAEPNQGLVSERRDHKERRRAS